MEHPPRVERSPRERIDFELAEQLLGYSFIQDKNARLNTEQTAILDAADTAFLTTRNSLEVAVRAAGMTTLSEAQLAEWRPQPGQVIRIQQELRGERQRARMLSGLASYISDPEKMAPLRGHQVVAMRKINGFLEKAPRNEKNAKTGYVNMATGTGKTGVFVHLVDALKSCEDREDPIRVVVLSPTQQILRQTIGKPATQEDEPHGFTKFTPHLQPTTYYQNEKNISPITVMTNASFNNLVESGAMPDFDAIIIDETHTGLGETISERIAEYSANKLVIGFTATPDYDTERKSSNLLDHEIHTLSLPESVKQGLLAPVKAELRELSIDFAPYDGSIEREAYAAALQKALFKARLSSSVPDIMASIQRGEGVILRCPPGDDAWYSRYAATLLRESESLGTNVPPRKLRAVSVGGSERSNTSDTLLIEAFNRGDRIEVMSYVKLINMGTDVPRAKLLVNLNPTASLVDMTQALGRLTRNFKNGKDEWSRAHCIDFVDSSLGDRQFSGLDVIGMRPAQLPVDWEMDDPLEEMASRDLSSIPDIDFDVYNGAIWEAEIGPDQDSQVQPPEASTISQEDKILTFREAAAWFDIKGMYLREYLKKHGLGDINSISMSDILVIEEANPELKIPFADPEVYVPLRKAYRDARISLDDLERELSMLGKTARLRNQAGKVETFVPKDLQF